MEKKKKAPKKLPKTWQEKLESKSEAQVKKINYKFADIPPNSTIFIPTAKIIDDYIKKIPKGKEVDIKKMRADLAKQYKAEYSCPVCVGIFLRIVAEACYENFSQGIPEKQLTPIWRAINKNMPIAKKITFPFTFIEERRKKEGLV